MKKKKNKKRKVYKSGFMTKTVNGARRSKYEFHRLRVDGRFVFFPNYEAKHKLIRAAACKFSKKYGRKLIVRKVRNDLGDIGVGVFRVE